MKIVIALDSFKGSLDAATASREVAKALRQEMGAVDTLLKPMADGGEGTARAMLAALGGDWVNVEVTGPLAAMTVRAGYAWLADRAEAVVEMAEASGLVLLDSNRRNPMVTTTRGTGELILAAIHRGAHRIWLAVGGSATVDGGVGAAQALGWRFLDETGRPVSTGGEGLTQVREILRPDRKDLPPVTVLCDVENPLVGPRGAARVYGPQKGASPEMVDWLEQGLENLAAHILSVTGKDVGSMPGAGAAGGLAAGATAFLGADLSSGADAVMEAIGLEEELTDADWVITGEGRFDDQSLQGKVVSGVTRLARKHGVPVVVLAGSVALLPAVYREAGIEVALAATPEGMPLEEAMARAPELLAAAARKFVNRHLRRGGKESG